MATIKIKRSNDYMMREFRLFIDGKKVGTIGNAQTKEFDIAAGQHAIIAKIDWCRSPELTFETNDKDSKIFLVGGLKSWRWLMPLGSIFIILSLLLNKVSHNITAFLVLIPLLYILYYLTIGSKKYLTIKELKQNNSLT
jgi:hypothetical protein